MPSKLKSSLIFRDAFLVTCLTIGLLWFLYVILLNDSYLNPIARTLEDFEMTDLYYSNLQTENHKVNKDIVLVNIGNNDRAAIATQIKLIQQHKPKVIGLDALFLNPKDSVADKQLAESIHQSDNLVLINRLDYIDNKNDPTLLQSDDKFSRDMPQGYSNFLSKENQTVRYFLPQLKINGRDLEAFSTQIVKKYDPDCYQAVLKRGSKSEIINYQNEGFLKIDVNELNDYAIAEKLHGKIVLMGFMGSNLNEISLEDRHLTPLNKSFGGFSIPDKYGIEIHAQIINMMLTLQYIYELSQVANFILIFLITFLMVCLFIYIVLHVKFWAYHLISICQILLFGLVSFISLVVFHYFKLKIEVGFILMAIATTVSIIDLYDEIAHWLNRKWGFKIYEKK